MVKFACRPLPPSPTPTWRSQADPGNEGKGGARRKKPAQADLSVILLVASAIIPYVAVAAGSGTADPGIYLRQEQIQRNAEQAQAHYQLGVLLEEAGQITEAIDHYRIAIRFNPLSARQVVTYLVISNLSIRLQLHDFL